MMNGTVSAVAHNENQHETAANSARRGGWLSAGIDNLIAPLKRAINPSSFADRLNDADIQQQLASRLQDLEEYGLLSSAEIAQRRENIEKGLLN